MNEEYTIEILFRVDDGEAETISRGTIQGKPQEAFSELPKVLVHTASAIFAETDLILEGLNDAYGD